MDLDPPSELERLYGIQALEEWRLVRRQFELGESFAFIVLTVPDNTAARLCRTDLQTFLANRDRTLSPVAPANPDELALLATTLLAMPNDRAIGAVWVEAVSDRHAADYPAWEAAWGRALGSLNQQRNLLRRRSAPLLLVGAPWLAPLVRQRAPDLWSVRALVARIDPVILDRALTEAQGAAALPIHADRGEPYSHQARPSSDVELGLLAAARLRGVAGSQRTLANVLARTAGGLDARGDWQEATAIWREAVIAYRAALEEIPRDRMPLDWAATQNNLGNALRTLGTRESGTDRLEQAITAYRSALEEYTRDRVPLVWAMTLNNLGNALRTLGTRESGTDRLEQAITAYRLALEEYTRDRVPLDWAMTQNNLANALSMLGERESGTERLEQAVAAYRLALQEHTRDRVPLDWAGAQNNLGTALQTLGQRESSTERLEQAVAAYRFALAERTRDRVPLDWAMTQNNLGIALAVLAERTHDRARMADAIAAMRNAAEVYRQANNTRLLPLTERAVKDMEAALAKMPP